MLLMVIKSKDVPLIRCKPDLEREGFAVDITHDGVDADRKVRTLSYDIVILDSRLPNANGFNLLRSWRTDGIEAEMLLLTARNDSAEIVHGLDLGADACLPRPFYVQELLARLRVFRRRNYPVPHRLPVQRIHDLEIDAGARCVKRGDTLVPLSSREFSLLEILIRHQGNVVTRRMIRNYLRIDEPRSSNVIDVHIHRLRQKIDHGRQFELIQACWGRGYCLRPER